MAATEQTKFQNRSSRATNSLQTFGDLVEIEEPCTGDFDAAITVSTTTTTTRIIIILIMNVRCWRARRCRTCCHALGDSLHGSIGVNGDI